jgi:hypothetical protein
MLPCYKIYSIITQIVIRALTSYDRILQAVSHQLRLLVLMNGKPPNTCSHTKPRNEMSFLLLKLVKIVLLHKRVYMVLLLIPLI